MKIEMLPIIIGTIVCLLGIGICFMAFQPEAWRAGKDRRRRVRAEPTQIGQLLLGAGTICMGAALMGRDTWRYATLIVFAGIAMIIAGGIMNREFLKELLLFRGAARRSDSSDKDKNANS